MRAVLRRLAACAALAAATLAVVPSPAHADQVIDVEAQATQVAARLAALNARLTVLSGRVARAQHDLALAQQRADRGRVELTAARSTLSRHRAELSDLAIQVYMGGGPADTGLLGDLDGTAAQAPVRDGYVATVGQHRSAIVDGAVAAEADVARRAESLTRDLKAAERSARRVRDEQRETEKALDQQTALQKTVDARLAALIAEQAHAGSGELDAPTPAAARATLAAALLTHLPPAPTPAAATAVNAALSVVGHPYLWGGAGPDRFDCSGLVLWSWAKAGLSLPHWTGDQVHLGWPVPLGQLVPGDLLFMWQPGAKGGPPDHVAMYIGNHLIVQAPHVGGFVEVSSMWWWDGAARAGVRLAAPPGH
jgi:cell wall-associated NlpC family hydrolase